MEIPKCHICGSQDWQIQGKINALNKPTEFSCNKCRFYANKPETKKLRKILKFRL